MFDYKDETINAFAERLAAIRANMWNLSTRQVIELTKDNARDYQTATMKNKISYMAVAGMYEDIDPNVYYCYVTLLAHDIRGYIKRDYKAPKKTIRIPAILVKVAQVSDSGKRRAERFLNTDDFRSPGSMKYLNSILRFHQGPEVVNYLDTCVGIEFWTKGNMRDIWAKDFARGLRRHGDMSEK